MSQVLWDNFHGAPVWHQPQPLPPPRRWYEYFAPEPPQPPPVLLDEPFFSAWQPSVALRIMPLAATIAASLYVLVLVLRNREVGAENASRVWDAWTSSPQVAAARQRERSRGQGEAQRRRNSQRSADVASAVLKLHTEAYLSRELLADMGAHQLKVLLRERGVDTGEALEKAEAVERLIGAGGSSAASCIICCEDYVGGDVLRVLCCGHRYHSSCIGRWFLTSTADYSRAPACPICNRPLLR